MLEVRRGLERSLSMYRRALELIPGASQTTSKRPTLFALGQYPIYASHGRGGHIWDVDGNEYVDFVMALGPITLGYCYPSIDDAVRRQLERGVVYGLLDEVELEAAEAVVARRAGELTYEWMSVWNSVALVLLSGPGRPWRARADEGGRSTGPARGRLRRPTGRLRRPTGRCATLRPWATARTRCWSRARRRSRR